MKYKSIPTVIDAEQLTVDNIPPGCKADGHGNYWVTTIQGQNVHVKFGEWIVDEGDGIHYYPIADSVFKRKYQLVD